MVKDLTHYICVNCTGKLRQEIEKLVCVECSKEVPYVGGIPRFAKKKYVANFGFEWNIHRNTQFDKGKREESKRHFEVRFEGHLNKFKNAKVLDVGVGVGRYADISKKLGAKVIGVDLSSSVDIAKKNLNAEDHQIVQADLFELPFAENTFDIIYSFGVIHHTPNPRLALSRLVRLLKPGGIICITVYEKGSMYHTSRYARTITTKLPNNILYLLCLIYVGIFYIPYKFLGFRYGFLGRILPISLSNNLAEAVLDTFDCYSPKYQFTYREGEIYDWFLQEDLVDIEFKKEPVTLLARK